MMAAKPRQKPVAENFRGFIETLAIDATGALWMIGWMRRDLPLEFPAVILAAESFAAGVTLMSFSRADLPANAYGVIGLVATSWRPVPTTQALHLFFGEAGRLHLNSHKPLRITGAGELAAEYEHIRERCRNDGRAAVLRQQLDKQETWHPSKGAAQSYGTETSVDRVMLVRGLGCLVEGWVMSPLKRVEALRVRVGGAVMSARPDALQWKPRPDLLSGFPGSEAMASRAGFIGLFTGDSEPDDVRDPVLKIVFEGGASANWSIAQKVFRRLGHSATVDDAQRYFPALREEPFFPEFAQAAVHAYRDFMGPLVQISVNRSWRVMVFVLPDDRCDLFLLFEEIAQQCRSTDPADRIEAVAFVAAAKTNRADALWLFREFQAAHCGGDGGLTASLFVIDDAFQAFSLLPDILRALGANRFFFAAAGVFLSKSGWREARAAIAAGRTECCLFGFEADDVAHSQAGCFAWSSGPFARWAETAPQFLGGYHHDNGLTNLALPCAPDRVATYEAAAKASRTQIPTHIQQAVNTAVLAMTLDAPIRIQTP